ncbi:NifB/NifX family molybdenum-iron cluster-binding protein [bacterium]|nr:NifB/NifX family molybdenum-iron cluster-binding protein [candidate division CSSED10-310 bacterium]
MRLAIPHWQNRISPVLDVAGTFRLVDIDQGHIIREWDVPMDHALPLDRTRSLAGLGVDAVICGAVSRQLENALTGAGIEILAQICGDVQRVIEAFLTGRLESDVYRMPGCRRRRCSRFRGGRMHRR